jgi:hypothetical protein
MEEFPNNSQRAKHPGDPEIDKQIDKIIEGQATLRKTSGWKRFRQSFIAGDATSVGEHVLWNLLIPSAKDALSDMASTFIDMMIYGEKRNRFGGGVPNSGLGSTSKFNYGAISTGSRLVNGPIQSPILEPVRRPNPNEIIVQSRAEGQGVLSKMYEVLEKYKVVTVADLYRMVDISSEYTDGSWGWNDLEGAHLKRIREGILISLPPPQDLAR